MSNWFKHIAERVTNEFTNPDSDLLSGRFFAKIKANMEKLSEPDNLPVAKEEIVEKSNAIVEKKNEENNVQRVGKTNIYILRLEEGKYYVGKSENVLQRYQHHIQGKGAAWTRKYKPISLENTIECASPFDEDKITKEYMSMYGIENVRGGSYVEIELSEFHTNALQMEIWTANNLCSQCGRTGHFVKDCYAKTDVSGKKIEFVEDSAWGCEYCEKTFATQFGCMVHERSCKEKQEKQEKQEKKTNPTRVQPKSVKQTITCYRCGRAGHKSPYCYASRHIDGHEL